MIVYRVDTRERQEKGLPYRTWRCEYKRYATNEAASARIEHLKATKKHKAVIYYRIVKEQVIHEDVSDG
jgi:hypothetical protein